jgi:hypothetical protein
MVGTGRDAREVADADGEGSTDGVVGNAGSGDGVSTRGGRGRISDGNAGEAGGGGEGATGGRPIHAAGVVGGGGDGECLIDGESGAKRADGDGMLPEEPTVKVTPLLARPPTVTMTGPLLAPAGTGAMMLAALQQ